LNFELNGENYDSYAIGRRSPLQRKIDNIDSQNETRSTSSFSINRPLRGYFRRRLETGEARSRRNFFDYQDTKLRPSFVASSGPSAARRRW